MAKNSNFSILVDVDFDASQIKEALNKASGGMADAAKGTRKIGDAAQYMLLNYQQATAVIRTCTDAIASMIDQVFTLDTALTELNMAHSYRKVAVK